MKFDCIIMNPPYCRDLHLKILAETIKHLKDDESVCVNLSPIPKLISIRNLYDDEVLNRNSKIEAYKHLKYVEKIDVTMFSDAYIQMNVGIQVYNNKKENNFDLTKYAISPISKELVRKIMCKCIQHSIINAKQEGEYILPISYIHGRIYSRDFYNILAMTYDRQLKSIGKIKVYFKTEDDRKTFYYFWMSKLGKFIISLWKLGSNIYPKYIPYLWFKNNEDAYKFFELTKEEQKIIEETIEETMGKYIK